MNLIGQLLSPQDVLIELDVADKSQLFSALATLLANRHGINQSAVLESLMDRERLGSTGIGHGVAIPHARMTQLPQAVAVYARTRLPIPFGAPDGKPVSHVVTLLVPKQADERHLKLLGSIAALFDDRAFREQLEKCLEPDAISRLFAEWPAR